MDIIAKTEDGYIIKATKAEINEILSAVNGVKPEKDLSIGQKIPAIDYASTIKKIQTLKEDYDFRNLINYSRKFGEYVKELNDIVEQSTKISI